MQNTSNDYIHSEIQNMKKKKKNWKWCDIHTFIHNIFCALGPRDVFR